MCLDRVGRRRSVSCPSCGVEACLVCLERYLLTSHSAQCVSCRCSWGVEFLRATFPASFMNKRYREHEKDVLLERAESTLPRLQEAARREVQEEGCRKEIAELVAQKKSLTEVLKKKRAELDRLLSGSPAGPVLFSCQWPHCRGKVLGGSLECGLCSRKYCPECRRVKEDLKEDLNEEPHVCLEEDVQTVRALGHNTRPCPTCQEGIFKEAGCDQMFCTACRTVFSWRTGRVVERGPIHNPHFVGPAALRAPGDVPCGGLPDYLHVYAHRSPSRDIRGVFLLTENLVEEVMPRVHRAIQRGPRQERRLSIRYLRGKIDRAKFRAKLYRERLRQEKQKRYHQVLDALSTGLVERVRAWVELQDDEETTTLVQECKALLDVANEELHRMRTQYGSHFPPLVFPLWGRNQ